MLYPDSATVITFLAVPSRPSQLATADGEIVMRIKNTIVCVICHCSQFSITVVTDISRPPGTMSILGNAILTLPVILYESLF